MLNHLIDAQSFKRHTSPHARNMLALSARVHIAPVVAVPHTAPRTSPRITRATTLVKATANRSASGRVQARIASALVVASTALVTLPALADTMATDAVPLTKNPAFLGFSCVAVCWGIPQMLGTAILEKKEANGRALLKRAGIDASDVGPGNWGKIQRLCQENGIDYKEQIL
jgi:hypothetical protein